MKHFQLRAFMSLINHHMQLNNFRRVFISVCIYIYIYIYIYSDAITKYIGKIIKVTVYKQFRCLTHMDVS